MGRKDQDKLQTLIEHNNEVDVARLPKGILTSTINSMVVDGVVGMEDGDGCGRMILIPNNCHYACSGTLHHPNPCGCEAPTSGFSNLGPCKNCESGDSEEIACDTCSYSSFDSNISNNQPGEPPMSNANNNQPLTPENKYCVRYGNKKPKLFKSKETAETYAKKKVASRLLAGKKPKPCHIYRVSVAAQPIELTDLIELK